MSSFRFCIFLIKNCFSFTVSLNYYLTLWCLERLQEECKCSFSLCIITFLYAKSLLHYDLISARIVIFSGEIPDLCCLLFFFSLLSSSSACWVILISSKYWHQIPEQKVKWRSSASRIDVLGSSKITYLLTSFKMGVQKNIITVLIQSKTETTQVYQMPTSMVDFCSWMLLFSCLNAYICAYIFIIVPLVA